MCQVLSSLWGYSGEADSQHLSLVELMVGGEGLELARGCGYATWPGNDERLGGSRTGKDLPGYKRVIFFFSIYSW